MSKCFQQLYNYPQLKPFNSLYKLNVITVFLIWAFLWAKTQSDLRPSKKALKEKSPHLVFYIQRLQFILITTRRLGSKIIQRLRLPFISGPRFPGRKGIIERNAECQIVFRHRFFTDPIHSNLFLLVPSSYTIDCVTTSNVWLRYISQLWISVVQKQIKWKIPSAQ